MNSGTVDVWWRRRITWSGGAVGTCGRDVHRVETCAPYSTHDKRRMTLGFSTPAGCSMRRTYRDKQAEGVGRVTGGAGVEARRPTPTGGVGVGLGYTPAPHVLLLSWGQIVRRACAMRGGGGTRAKYERIPAQITGDPPAGRPSRSWPRASTRAPGAAPAAAAAWPPPRPPGPPGSTCLRGTMDVDDSWVITDGWYIKSAYTAPNIPQPTDL